MVIQDFQKKTKATLPFAGCGMMRFRMLGGVFSGGCSALGIFNAAITAFVAPDEFAIARAEGIILGIIMVSPLIKSLPRNGRHIPDSGSSVPTCSSASHQVPWPVSQGTPERES